MTTTGPLPKFHETRDNLFGHARGDSGGWEILVAVADVVQEGVSGRAGSAPDVDTLENWERLQREWI